VASITDHGPAGRAARRLLYHEHLAALKRALSANRRAQMRGMSVAPDSPENFPAHRRPPEHGGTGKDPIWELDVTELGDELVYREDPLMPGVHGFVEPVSTTTFAAYESALIATRRAWRLP
jgi:hypothetical protein